MIPGSVVRVGDRRHMKRKVGEFFERILMTDGC